MTSSHVLTGITWDHSRAFPPLAATAQRFEETHPGTRIRWEKRTLDEFGHMSVEVLAERFDLVVIDHPWAGFAFARNLFYDLLPLVGSRTTDDFSRSFVGASFESYVYQGKLLAIPIDAATPTPSYRPDLLRRAGAEVPQTWSELVALSRRGMVLMPGWHADLFLNWHMLCVALGGDCYSDVERVVERDVGLAALDMLRCLVLHMPSDIFEFNPIRVAEIMASGDEFAYCPFAYSYSNYCRSGFAPNALRYGGLVQLDNGSLLRSVIGGTGLAISRRCLNPELAIEFCLFTASPEVQSGIYGWAGGQPARREAWKNADLNAISGNFFYATEQAQESALIRPRYDGYVPLQERGGRALARHLRDGAPAGGVLDEVDMAYRQSLGNRSALSSPRP